MLRNYLTTALRHLLRHRAYALVNVLGMAVGMACCLLILLDIQYELSFESFHRNADRIHYLEWGGLRRLGAPLSPLLPDDIPEIEAVVLPLEHQQTKIIVTAERAFLNRLEGSCQIPIAAYGEISEDTLTLSGLVANIDGTTVIKEVFSGEKDSAEKIGIALADRLLSMGAKEIMGQVEHFKL